MASMMINVKRVSAMARSYVQINVSNDDNVCAMMYVERRTVPGVRRRRR